MSQQNIGAAMIEIVNLSSHLDQIDEEAFKPYAEHLSVMLNDLYFRLTPENKQKFMVWAGKKVGEA